MQARLFWLWSLVVLVLTGLLAAQIRRGIHFETDLFALLPASEQDEVLSTSLEIFQQTTGHRLVFLLGHTNVSTVLAAADQLHAALQEEPSIVVQNQLDQDTLQRSTYELYAPYRYALLAPKDRALLLTQGPKEFLERSRAHLFGPLGSFYSKAIAEDPALLLPSFLQQLPRPAGSFHIQRGHVVLDKDGQTFALVSATTKESPFSRNAQRHTTRMLESLVEQIHKDWPDVTLHWTGIMRFAAAGAQDAERDTSRIGTGSVLGVLFLMVVTFRSLRQMVLGILPIAIGVAAAFTLCLYIFPNLHLITLGFGASLIGVCVDYSFHFFAEQLRAGHAWDAQTGLRRIRTGVTLGVVTSILGYMALYVAPFPGLRQMAVFSSIGLLGAFGTVLCWYPSLAGKPRTSRDGPLQFADQVLQVLLVFSGKKIRWCLAPVLLAFIAVGWTKLHVDDDVRLLQHQQPELIVDERFIRERFGGHDVSRFFYVEGTDEQQVLEREERLIHELERLREQGSIQFYQGISSYVPSMQTQQSNRSLIRQSFGGTDGPLARHMATLGVAKSEKHLADLHAIPTNTLTLSHWLNSPVSTPLQHLWVGETSHGLASIVLVSPTPGLDPYPLLSVVHSEGAHYVDQVSQYSSILGRYRHLASILILVSYGIIFLLLLVHYGAKRGIAVLVPPILASLLTLACFAFAGQSVHFFHVLALLLVLGIGIDYTIFFAEAKDGHHAVMLAVLLSAGTTILSFGLLALSSTPVLQAFGSTVWLGIGFALLLAPLAIVMKEVTMKDG